MCKKMCSGTFILLRPRQGRAGQPNNEGEEESGMGTVIGEGLLDQRQKEKEDMR